MVKNPSCLDCIFFNLNKWGTCKAFPDGIPIDVNFGVVSHTKPYKGDNGIQFSVIPKEEREKRRKEIIKAKDDKPKHTRS